MEYIDPYNYPENALRQYAPESGMVYPDLHHGSIFRVITSNSFVLERLLNQLDGAKFFVEVYNISSSRSIAVTFDPDYRAIDGGGITTDIVPVGGVISYEIICRLGLMYVFGQVGAPEGEEILNPLGDPPLINPLTGEPLLNPGS